MNKKLVIFTTIVTILASFLVLMILISNAHPLDSQKDAKVDIVMTPQSSRPGCDKNDSCFVPSTLTITHGQSVTWENQDSGFHTVTSGTYENPDGLFDSGHIDPDNSFTYTFKNAGTFDFFCSLHPWMYGKIIVN